MIEKPTPPNAESIDVVTAMFDPLNYIPTEASTYQSMREYWPVIPVSLAIRRRSWIQAGGALCPDGRVDWEHSSHSVTSRILNELGNRFNGDASLQRVSSLGVTETDALLGGGVKS
jgi:hypothetical protein